MKNISIKIHLSDSDFIILIYNLDFTSIILGIFKNSSYNCEQLTVKIKKSENHKVHFISKIILFD